MSLTLAEYKELTNDQMEKGIIEELINDIPLFRKLPFETITGSAKTYDREDEDQQGSVDFYNIHEQITKSEAHFTQETASLYSLIGDAKVNNLAKKSMSNINDQMAAQVAAKAKQMGEEFEYHAVYGTTSSKGFEGLHSLIADSATTQTLVCAADATGDALTALLLDEAVDNCRASGDKIIVTTKRVKRNMAKYLRTVGSYESTRDEYGHSWKVWGDDEIPIVTCDKMLNTELCASTGLYASVGSGSTSSLFVLTLGENGVQGLQNGGITTQKWDRLENEDSSMVRMVWYVGLCLKSTKGLVRIGNITNAAMEA